MEIELEIGLGNTNSGSGGKGKGGGPFWISPPAGGSGASTERGGWAWPHPF
jgi:hypothetical protein